MHAQAHLHTHPHLTMLRGEYSWISEVFFRQIAFLNNTNQLLQQ